MDCYNYDKDEEEERLEPDEDDARLTPPSHGTPTMGSREGHARRTTTLDLPEYCKRDCLLGSSGLLARRVALARI
jgi:hypothetical protein